jgi:hypothetical protein
MEQLWEVPKVQAFLSAERLYPGRQAQYPVSQLTAAKFMHEYWQYFCPAGPGAHTAPRWSKAVPFWSLEDFQKTSDGLPPRGAALSGTGME